MSEDDWELSLRPLLVLRDLNHTRFVTVRAQEVPKGASKPTWVQLGV